MTIPWLNFAIVHCGNVGFDFIARAMVVSRDNFLFATHGPIAIAISHGNWSFSSSNCLIISPIIKRIFLIKH